ncbi:hypothetical protein [Lentibacillus salinarum]|uniref:Uncharacterized protein n=1 Tax=Lentibacillus salinarum TaxID=446820 RepID=A0ABW3ZUH2_9BACI
MKKMIVLLGVVATVLVGTLTFDAADMAGEQLSIIQNDPVMGDLDHKPVMGEPANDPIMGDLDSDPVMGDLDSDPVMGDLD